MKWSWKIGEFAGIGVYMHATFLLLIAWVAVTHGLLNGNLAGAAAGVVFTMALFTCVVLHEYGHALTAKHYGIRTRDITLLPIGGVARLERMPEDPKQELWVALAGPVVNVAIAAAIGAWLVFSGQSLDLRSLSLRAGGFWQQLLMLNLFLAGFNLLPAFPMDGGRVVRALLATRLDYARATQIATTLGQGMALVFGFLGFFGNPMLLFIALFVWIGATQESGMVQMKSALGGIPLARAMVTDFRTLPAGQSLAYASDALLAGAQTDFPVEQHGRIVGILTHSDLIKALIHHGPGARLEDVMQREFLTADVNDMLEPSFQRLQACECHTMPVLEHGRLVGLLTMENLGELLMIQAAVRSQDSPPAGTPMPARSGWLRSA